MGNWKLSWPLAKWLSMEDAIWYVVICYLVLHMFCFPFVVYPSLSSTGPTWLGLDVSWQIALNYAIANHLNWGHDIVFSYGPLGFLATRVGWGISKWIFIIFDLFLIFNLFSVFRDFVFKSREKMLAVIILFCITLLINPYYGSDLSWVFMFFTFYWMYKAYKTQYSWHNFIIIFLIGLSFYIKLNTALVIIFFYIGYLINLVIFKSISYKKALILLLVSFIWILSLAILFNVSLVEYVKGSLEIIKGYNDIMYLQEDHESVEKYLVWALRLFTFLFTCFACVLIWKRRYKEVYFVLISIAFVFLLAKQSQVRNDVQHLYEFFSIAPLVLLTGNLLIDTGKIKKYFLQGILAIILLALLVKTSTRPLENAMNERFGTWKDYKELIKDYNQEEYINHKDKRYIPGNILEKVGHNSIDVFPWDIEYLIQNKLNYTPRPVFQSYTAYTTYLEEKNYEYYLVHGPDFVIYDYDAIDNRYPFNDELKVNLFLAKNYLVSDTFTSNERWRLLLKRNPEVHPLELNLIKEETLGIEEEITVDKSSCIKIDLEYNLFGKYQTFTYKPPPINIQFMKANGEWISFKTSTALLSAGVMTDKLILTNHDFAAYITNKDSLSPVKKFKLVLDKYYFNPEMKLSHYKIRD